MAEKKFQHTSRKEPMSKIYEALLQAELERLNSDPNAVATLETAQRNVAATAAALGVTPLAPSQPTPSTPLRSARPGIQTIAWDKIPTHVWHPVLDYLPALQHRSAAAEQFRSLRARMYEYRGFNKLKSILVSSGQAQEGKSFVACNLALTLAYQKDNRVLLIDGDLRRSTVHKMIGCKAEPGLAEYLLGTAEAYDIMQRADLGTARDMPDGSAMANLTVVPGGSGGEAVADLASNERFRTLLEMVAPTFDWIVVDSSPVNLVSDSVHMARECDGVLLVVRSGITQYELAQRAQNEFKSSNVLGVVLNGSTEAPPTGYYGYESGE
ncbi:MAG: CpsD/CapB family tyrosine-protein kinase [Acidobacteria bacterium]|nr:CpsD/CapB family tyrosine-protein kinase [Acidobacteriota bacterium]